MWFVAHNGLFASSKLNPLFTWNRFVQKETQPTNLWVKNKTIMKRTNVLLLPLNTDLEFLLSLWYNTHEGQNERQGRLTRRTQRIAICYTFLFLLLRIEYSLMMFSCKVLSNGETNLLSHNDENKIHLT